MAVFSINQIVLPANEISVPLSVNTAAGLSVIDKWISSRVYLQLGEDYDCRLERYQVVVREWTVSCVGYLLGKSV